MGGIKMAIGIAALFDHSAAGRRKIGNFRLHTDNKEFECPFVTQHAEGMSLRSVAKSSRLDDRHGIERGAFVNGPQIGVGTGVTR